MAKTGVIITVIVIVLIIIVGGFFILHGKSNKTITPPETKTPDQTNYNTPPTVPNNQPVNTQTPTKTTPVSSSSGDPTLNALTSDSATGETDDSATLSQESTISSP